MLVPDPPASLVVPLPVPWYVDLARRQIGPLQVPGNPAVVARLFSLPPLSATAAALVGEALSEPACELPGDPEQASVAMRSIVAEPLPVLRLQTLGTHGNRSWREYLVSYGGGPFDVALPVFRYADVEVIPDDMRDFSTLASGEMVRIERQRAREDLLMDELAGSGLEKIPGYVLHTFGRPPDNAYGLAQESSWPVFMRERIAAPAQQRLAGRLCRRFRHRLLEVEAWDADLVDSGHGWFELDMGIVVEGERLPLAPLLPASSGVTGAGSIQPVGAGRGQRMVELVTGAGLRIRVPAWRLKPLAATLIDLFDGFTGGSSLRVSRFDAPRLTELNDSARWRFKGQSDVLALAEQLSAAQGIRPYRAASRARPGVASLPDRRVGLAAVPARTESRGNSRRRHGSGQDGADTGAPAAGKGVGPARPAGTDRAAHLTDLQLDQRGRPLCPRAVDPFAARTGTKEPLCRHPAPRRGADDLSTAMARRQPT
jgi:hypothetical protein